MLVLSRQRDESIIVILEDGREIEFIVVDIRGDKVRCGIEAALGIKIHRKEVWQSIKRENRNSTSPKENSRNSAAPTDVLTDSKIKPGE